MMDINCLQLQLMNVVENGFKRPYPGDENICITRTDTDRYDGNFVYDFFHGKEWRIFLEKDFVLLKRFFSKVRTFSYFTPKGFAYYLPAFLIFVSRHQDQDFMESLFYRLQPGANETRMAFFNEFFSSLSAEEILAVRKTLECLTNIWSCWGEKSNWAQDALENYWSNL
jgi:hypothetical protein